MKKYLYLLLLPLIVSCNNGSDPLRVGYYHALVVKFTNPEYKNYIYAEDLKYQIQFRGWGDRRVCDEFIAGRCPYIDLEDGYVLTDWKWPWVIYNMDVLLNKPWSEMTSLDQKWHRDTVEIIPGPYIEEQYWIYFYDIDAYLNVLKKQGYESSDPIDFAPYTYGWMHSRKGNSLKESERKKYTRYVEICDSIQDEYVQKLKYIIHSGNFPFAKKYNWW